MKRVEYVICKKMAGERWPGVYWDGPLTERESIKALARYGDGFRVVRVTAKLCSACAVKPAPPVGGDRDR